MQAHSHVHRENWDRTPSHDARTCVRHQTTWRTKTLQALAVVSVISNEFKTQNQVLTCRGRGICSCSTRPRNCRQLPTPFCLTSQYIKPHQYKLYFWVVIAAGTGKEQPGRANRMHRYAHLSHPSYHLSRYPHTCPDRNVTIVSMHICIFWASALQQNPLRCAHDNNCQCHCQSIRVAGGSLLSLSLPQTAKKHTKEGKKITPEAQV